MTNRKQRLTQLLMVVSVLLFLASLALDLGCLVRVDGRVRFHVFLDGRRRRIGRISR